MDFKVHYNKIILEFDKIKIPVGIVFPIYSCIYRDKKKNLISEMSYEKWKKTYSGIKIDMNVLEDKDSYSEIFLCEPGHKKVDIFDHKNFFRVVNNGSDEEFFFTQNLSFRKRNEKLHIHIFYLTDFYYTIIDWDDCVKNKFLQLQCYIVEYKKIIIEHGSFNRYLEKFMCANRIQKACHNWLYSPVCKDGSVGLMVMKDLKELKLYQ